MPKCPDKVFTVVLRVASQCVFYGASAKAEVEIIWLPLRLHEAADARAFLSALKVQMVTNPYLVREESAGSDGLLEEKITTLNTKNTFASQYNLCYFRA